MLGQELCRALEAEKIEYTGTDREVSILDPEALSSYGEKHNPDWIINCSAYTAVDKAEDETDAAYSINRDGVANLARIAEERDIPIIHISTDYVFDGTSEKPLNEEAPTGPVGVYGASKLAGEESLRRIASKHFIIRTAWLYGQYGPNFVYTMVKLMNSRESIKVVADQIGSPTWARDLADLIAAVIESGSEKYGTYHFSGEGQCSWHEFAGEIFRLGREKGLVKTECNINPCSSGEYPTKAKRPAYSLLSKEKVSSKLQFNVPDWNTSLKYFMNDYQGLHSRVSNWIEHAEYDLETAKAMTSSGRYLYVCITCQQSIEKMIKAIYEFRNLSVPRIHDLLRLIDGLSILPDANTNTYLKDLSYYYIASRYNERISKLSIELNRERSEFFLEKTEEVIQWLKLKIPYL